MGRLSMYAAGRCECGPVSITWDPDVRWPLAVNHVALNSRRRKIYVTTTEITFRRGKLSLAVPPGYRFDGATIPMVFWCVPGFHPLGKHIWAAVLHDYLCDLAALGEFDRVIADAVFVALLEHCQVGGWRGTCMDLAVNLYRRFKKLT